MSDIPSVPKRIQVEETEFEAPVSESTAMKMGGTMNFLLDNYAIPPGASMAFNGIEANVPPGWIPEDGRAVSRAIYANLYAAIGTLWGVGDGLTTFNVPDKRGRFDRMVDATSIGAAGRDPDAAARLPQGSGTAAQPGSAQADEIRSHNHKVPRNDSGVGQATPVTFDADPSVSNWTPTSAFGGNETRPMNVYVLSIVKT